jgi:hypothetical protein
MKVSELIERLREFDQESEVFVQYERSGFARPVWIGIMDTASLFEEEKDFKLVISPWEPQDHFKPGNSEQRA